MATSEDALVKFMNSCLLKNLDTPAIMLTPEMNITYANKEFLNLFSKSEKEILGNTTCEETCGTNLCGTKDCPVQKAVRIK